MAKCPVCKLEMLTASGCGSKRLQFTAKGSRPQLHDKIPYGSGRRGGMADLRERCPDCNVERGKFHHPNCDQEECPICHGQLLGCGCNDAGTFADMVERVPVQKKGKR